MQFPYGRNWVEIPLAGCELDDISSETARRTVDPLTTANQVSVNGGVVWSAACQRRSLEAVAPVSALAFSADGALLAGACHDGTVRLWEVESGDLLSEFEGLSSGATCLAFDPEAARLAAGT
ncbi:MAG TPA: hypothetical protein VGY66_37130, partial [Gemmataceae bacterium]|nr:hypothetical protein [Gemmataceae bacterium]